jgi:D-alanine-D-alanine ligase
LSALATGDEARKRRIRVGVVFGGRSGEHEVSLRSARSVMNALDPARYEVVPIGITREGAWMLTGDPMAALTAGDASSAGSTAILADPSRRGLRAIELRGGGPLETGGAGDESAIDVVFPVLHGPFGEDGTIQGLLEMANVPYVGAGVLGSALGMDKAVQKSLLRTAGLPVVDWLDLTVADWRRRREQILVDVEAKVGYPCFVKPANMGSSVGVSKAADEAELARGIENAAGYDRKIVVEWAVPGAREIEVSVLGNDDPEASLPGEIVPDREWYDYDSKYSDSQTQLIIPAQLPPESIAELRRLAVSAFKAIDGAGMARVDFLADREAARLWINELNTIPGFTSISMYPKLWEASGLPYAQLCDRLIELAIERHAERSKMRTDRG